LTSFSATKTRTSKENPCPICFKTDGCRIFVSGRRSRENQKIWCLRSDANTRAPGYRNLGNLRDGMGASFVPIKDTQPLPKTTPAWKRTHKKLQKPAAPWQDGHRTVHQFIWEHADPQLKGRFPKKLADAAITDSYYCRYLNQENIEAIERLVEHRVAQGVFAQAQVLASGYFRLNTGFEGRRFRLNIPVGRILAVHDLAGELVAIRANPEVPLWLYNRKKEKYEEYKYLQAKGVPTHPHFPKVSSARLKELWATNQPYILVISEGEDTTESPAQNLQVLGDLPIVFVSLPGVEGWINSSGQPKPNYASWLDDLGHLHPELKKVISHAAHVVLGFDSDVMVKKEVKWAINRLGQAIWSGFDGKIVPLIANWNSLLRSHPELKQRKYGLDDLLGELISKGESLAPVFEDLLAPSNAAMIRRTWQRLGTTCAINHAPLLTVDESYQATEEAVKDWLQGNGPQHRVVASTPGVGKTEAADRVVFARMQAWVQAGHEIRALQLQQDIRSLESRKKLPISDTERFQLLAEAKGLRQQLQRHYRETLGGPLIILSPNLKSLDELQERLRELNGGTDPFWVARRVGRETPDPELQTKNQMEHGSLICAHHEPVSLIGSQAHSPSALACSSCFWGKEGRCGFLDSIQEAHLAPVVLATGQAVLNASEELANYAQIIVDENLPQYLFTQVTVSDHLPKLVNNLQVGLRLDFWGELYDRDTLEDLLTVFGELETAHLRYRRATPEEIQRRGDRVSDWMEAGRVAEPLNRLSGLRPLRMDMDKLEPVAATYYPWERPRYSQGQSGQYLHEETYGDAQQLAFDSIPLRGTDALLEALRHGLIDHLDGANLTFEGMYDPTVKEQQAHIYLYRPQAHLIELLNQSRVLNLDATPNSLLLRAFLPNVEIDHHDAKLNLRILQILSGPPGKISEGQIKELIPALRVFGQKGPTLLMTSKQATQWLEQATEINPISGLISMPNAKGQMAPGAYYGYHDRAFDDPRMKSAQTMVLAGSYVPHIGHLTRVTLMLKRYLALHKRSDILPKRQEPYRVHSYGPEGYELVEEVKDPLLDELIYEERMAALIQAINRPRPVRKKEQLTVILYRSDPVPEPYNRYVKVLGSVEELFGVSLALKNKANAGRLVEAWHRHGEAILNYFLKFKRVPSARVIQKIAGGSRGRSGSITRALAWFSAQVLPALPGTVGGTKEGQKLYEQFLASLLEAAEQYFLPVLPSHSCYELDEQSIESYWLERYRQSSASQKLVCWICTRQLSQSLHKKLEQIEPFAKLMGNLSPHVPQPQARKRPP
jgi:Domain of unknown function (DUF3854)